ncbi:MAG: biopolymer transporter ExbD [Pseudomonadota bacterium]
MIRQRLQHHHEMEEETRIDLSPLIDVVFILLIFFIVSTVFIRESGVEVNKPEASNATRVDEHLIIIALTARGEVMHAGANIGVPGIRATIEPLLETPDDPVVLQADAAVTTDQLVRVIDQLKAAGAENVLLATKAEE